MTTDTEYEVNELLMLMFSKLDTDTSEDIIHVVDGFYGDEAVSDTKAILWGRYSLLAAAQSWQKAGFYSYCPGRRLLPALTGFYWLLPGFTGFK